MFGMSSDSPSSALLTDEGARRIIQDVTEAQQRLAEAQRRADALRLVIGDARYQALLTPVAGSADGEEATTWPKLILDILARDESGMTYVDIREAIMQTSMAENLQRSPNSFFNTVKRLERTKKIERRGKRLFLTHASAPIQPRQERPKNGAPLFVMKVLKNTGRPMSAGQMIQAIKDHPDCPGHLISKVQPIYTAISRLYTDGEIKRTNDKRYYLPGDGVPEPESQSLPLTGGHVRLVS